MGPKESINFKRLENILSLVACF